MRIFSYITVFILAFQFVGAQSRPISSATTDNPNNRLGATFNPPMSGYSNDFVDEFGLPWPQSQRSKPAFQPGIIIKKDGDTLAGLVKYASPGLIEKVIYRTNLLASDSLVSIDNIKSIITQFVYLANIPFKGGEKMMPWLAVGKINLFVTGKTYINNSTELTYALEKNNQFTYINKQDFKVMMRHIFFDTPDMQEKIGKKGYRFDNMAAIIKDYNKRFY